jgi:hypothetical protein
VRATPGYSQTTTLQQDTLIPFTSISNPFPGGLTAISGNSLGMLTGREQRHHVHRSESRRARRASVLRRHSRQLPTI